ncbi:TetR/AcrR family transcriptional regulator [Streptomyces populi]|uniref:TetR/AcrR family transcriptional regulator n=1 Tax=Streptomyces populi TaxID=2058924 RepID=A0A2I0SBX8_9ACTN|nr:TetR/AcrR family transcriptional regulator [Streptomyces populi]PKT67455.1 TetR/AcrR family transcriptional regulator [Streptomyces populi]
MAIQERAARTRGRLVLAAAQEIDRVGYEGARLSRICQSADVSMGALTFHFPSKGALADAVQEQGWGMARSLVDKVLASTEPGLQAVIELTVGLAALLERDVVARAAARLGGERQAGSAPWFRAWLPVVEELLERARKDGGLRSGEKPEAVTAMVTYLLAGAESQIRSGRQAASGGTTSVADQLEEIWRLALRGIADPDA